MATLATILTAPKVAMAAKPPPTATAAAALFTLVDPNHTPFAHHLATTLAAGATPLHHQPIMRRFD